MKTNITEKQKNVLELIYESIMSSGFPPTFADLKELLSLSSNQAVLNYLIALEKQGFIKREEGQARGIRIAPLGLKVLGKQRLAPVVGMVAAGPCIESFSETQFKWIELPVGIAENEKIKKSEDVFIIHVTGDSMINAGIDNGNMLLVRKSKEYKSGDIVIARTDSGRTVKRFIAEGGKRYLKPENPIYQNIPIIPGEVFFEGQVIVNLSKIK
ncbi:MAG: repressor LexA [Parcubacteria group bacterium Athens0714_26]|nr:MAG: repressor LexA [Parcubacteria group bacterium Athens1014_26]TSD02000.1 MAG: repressor LexA [Parcubacteria group bacterium Athens0714_26]